MSNKNNSSTKPRGRLPVEIQQRLFRDIEASETRDLSCRQLCNYRPNIYGNPKSTIRRAVQNKYQWYKKLKKENIKQYWSLYAQSNSFQDTEVDTNKEEKELDKSDSELDIDSQGEEDKDRKEEEEEVSLFLAPCSPPQKNWSPSMDIPDWSPLQETASYGHKKQNIMSPVPFSLLSPERPKHFDSYTEAETYGKFIKFSFFYYSASFDAKFSLVPSSYSADEIIQLNFEYPERNGDFFVLQVTDVKINSELVDQIKIILPHLTDLHDFKHFQAQLILKGKGILVQMPSVPRFLLENLEEFFSKESKRCERTEQIHAVHTTKIINDFSRQVKTVLLLFPAGVSCAPAFGNDAKLTLRAMSLTHTMASKTYNQIYFPGFWLFKVLSDDRRLLKLEEGDTMETAFQGMTL